MAENRAIIKSFKILEVVANHPDGVTLSEIVKETKLPKSTVFDILEALYNLDAIYFKDRYRKSYVIGSRLFAVGQAYTKNSNLIQNASDLIEMHSDKYSTNCEVYKRVGKKVVCVSSISPKSSRLASAAVGAMDNVTNCPVGLVFLAYLPKDEVESLMELVPALKKPAILAQIAKVAAQGFVLDSGIKDNCVYTYAVPIFNFENKIVGVVSASKIRNNSEGIGDEISLLIEIGKQISKRQGYRK